MNKSLMLILKTLKKQKREVTYYIPSNWNSFNYKSFVSGEKDREGEIYINPYDFFIDCINKILSRKIVTSINNRDYDIKRNTIYGMHIRSFTTWDNYSKGEYITGTFLKTICLLPYIKKFGIDILYILPVFNNGTKYKKGEIGSPYAIKNIYEIDDKLHDYLLGDKATDLIEFEFKALIEAVHLLDMKIVLDFVFRSVSRDNDLIIKDPELFYWVKLDSKFFIPEVDGLKKPKSVNKELINKLYTQKGLNEYIDMFTYSPNIINGEIWQNIKLKCKESTVNVLDIIEKEYRITTIPGFSDVLNDKQPPWYDVTFLKFYKDIHKQVDEYLNTERIPPFLLHDGIKLSIFNGKNKNNSLWKYISNVLPYYQTKFGIDGARIDMAHSLPKDLLKDIIDEGRKINNKFIFWSEELSTKHSNNAKESGFDFISGMLWSTYKNLEDSNFDTMLESELKTSVIPISASLETPDTPRASFLHKNKKRYEILTIVNFLLPNTIPYINSGIELYEIQPMNLGLDNTEEGRFLLKEEDAMYGKLAFFDIYKLNWKSKYKRWISDLINFGQTFRRKYFDLINDINNFSIVNTNEKYLSFYKYINNETKEQINIYINRNFKQETIISMDYKNKKNFILIYSNYFGNNSEKNYNLKPGEIRIYHREKI